MSIINNNKNLHTPIISYLCGIVLPKTHIKLIKTNHKSLFNNKNTFKLKNNNIYIIITTNKKSIYKLLITQKEYKNIYNIIKKKHVHITTISSHIINNILKILISITKTLYLTNKY